MNGSVLDTNVIIKMMHNEIEAIQLLEKIKEKYLPIIVVGELLFGAYNSTKRDANIKAFEELFAQFEILMIDEKTAHSYALIKSELKKNATPIPENDIWIAAIAHAHNLSVASFDDHFTYVSAVKRIH